jgi:hypothetical protein
LKGGAEIFEAMQSSKEWLAATIQAVGQVALCFQQ